MAISIPNIFLDNTLILSDEVNENFAELGQRALNSAGDTITGNIEVDGGITIDGVDISEALGLAGNLNITSLHTSGNVDIDGTLNVDGATTLKSLTVLTTSLLKGAVTTESTVRIGTLFAIGGVTSASWPLINYGATYLTGATHVNSTLGVQGGLTCNASISVPVGEVYAGAYFREAGRTTPLGHWITAPFVAANYTAPAPATWTLVSADQVVLRYAVIGKTMHVAYYINDSTVGVADTSELRIKIPGGFVAAAGAMARGVSGYINAGVSTSQIGSCAVFPNDTFIRIFTFGGPWSPGTNNTDANGSITFEVA